MLPLLFAAALTSQDVQAKSNEIYMWGVGGNVGTIAYPGRFPLAFPKDPNGGKVLPDEQKTRGDVFGGVRGVLYINKDFRGAVRGNLGSGSNFKSSALTFEVDKIIAREAKAGAFAGVGLGFGNMRWDKDNGAELTVPTYLIRGQAGGNYRLKEAMFELGLFAQFVWPGVQTLSRTNGNEQEVKGGNYLHGGLEATVYYGDFTRPKKKKKKKKKGKGKRKK